MSSQICTPPAPDSGAAGVALQQGTALKHLPALDGLRGLAISLVLMHNLSADALPPTSTGRILEFALNIGWIGVQLFFVLSGFLITRILLRTQSSPNYYRAFFGRRVLRIFPLYYGVLLVAFVALPLMGVGSPALAHDQEHQVWLWLYLSNWTHVLNFDSRLFPHFWSLAIEEQFYLLWPLLLHRRTARQVLRLSIAIAVVSLLVRAAMLWFGAHADSVYTYTVCRMDALALGAVVAALLEMPATAKWLSARRQSLAWGAVVLWMLGLIVTHGYPRLSPLGQTLGYSWLACVFAIAVLAVACGPAEGRSPVWEKALAALPLRTLGEYSYAMYVFHKLLDDWIGKPMLAHFGLLDQPSFTIGIGYVVAASLATLALAALSYHFFEKHFLSLKRGFIADLPRGPTANSR